MQCWEHRRFCIGVYILEEVSLYCQKTVEVNLVQSGVLLIH